jgi:hypothetical protein
MYPPQIKELFMVALHVYDPSGASEITRLHAKRMASLDNKNIAMISDDMWQAHRVLPMIREYLEANFPGIEVIPETSFPMGSTAIDRDQTADMLVERGVDAVVVGNAS